MILRKHGTFGQLRGYLFLLKKKYELQSCLHKNEYDLY